ncbi:MAG: gliding motility protein RemB, partial [Flavobacteriaceae bacterium]|nr:gliding motility protein RemB [Flavobacteriaceae bacterium]
WFAFDMGVDLQLGRDTNRSSTTWNNTRLATVSGGIGKQLSFSATVFESQGFFAGYFNDFARSIAPAGGNPGIIPGMGVGKEFNGDSFDFPVATGYVSYQSSKYFNFQLGHGKQFIGDGYRSLFISDFASPYPYAKLTTRFWKLEYTNTWMSVRDVRRDVAPTGPFKTKYIANHYLSWNVSKRLNLGFYETVIWDDTNDRGFDFNFLNPVIFFRAIEFSTGSRGGNALIGLSAKYKFSDRVNFYAQWLIDEFSSVNVFEGDGSFKNKFGIQLGAKYYNAFGVDNLMLQLEYNQARPYTYSHNTIDLNFAHTNLALAHPWGANFREGIAIARYQENRWYGDGKLIIGRRGLDFDGDDTAFGGDIFTSENNRPRDNNNSIGQGNTTDYLYAELEAGYLINPMSRLKVFGNVIYRNTSPIENTAAFKDESTFWVSLGIRTDIFNWYKDF